MSPLIVAPGLLDDVGRPAEHVQVIEYRAVARPVHGGEFGAAAAARSPALDSNPYFGTCLVRSILGIFHRHPQGTAAQVATAFDELNARIRRRADR